MRRATSRPGRRVVPGLEVYGFDGSLIGAITAVSARDLALEIWAPTGELLRLPASLAALITREFVVLRGTARELRALGVRGKHGRLSRAAG